MRACSDPLLLLAGRIVFEEGGLHSYDRVVQTIRARNLVHIVELGGETLAVKQYALHDDVGLRRVRRELGVLCRLTHPNIVQVRVSRCIALCVVLRWVCADAPGVVLWAGAARAPAALHVLH